MLFLKKRPMQSLVGTRRSVCEREKRVKAGVEGSHDGWRAKKGKEAQKETGENQEEPSHTASGRHPGSKLYREAGTNGSVPGFRGSEKGNGHPPNGGPGRSARHSHLPAPRGPSAPRPGPSGAEWERADRGRFPVARPPGSQPSLPARRRAPRANARKRRLRRFSSKQTLLGLRRTRRPLPHAVPRFQSPRSAGGPSPAAPRAARTAHQLLR